MTFETFGTIAQIVEAAIVLGGTIYICGFSSNCAGGIAPIRFLTK